MSRRKGPEERPAVTIPSPEADQLVQQAKAGDSDAFAALFRATLSIVFNFLYGRSKDRALAEDLASETFLKAMKAIGGFEGTSRDFLSWVLRIGRNQFLDHVKSGRVRWESVVEEMPASVAASNPEREALGRIEGEQLRRALKQLTPEQQEVLSLRFLQDLPIADVAAIVGREQGAVKAMQFRALRSLAKVLAAEGAAEEWDT
ncbi:MAG TPA: RNA polymerase sigma factor [Actinomycetota bacterium]|nr:RNA polymerase sigma factor [Actinomycetota bacterium]